MGVPRDDPDLHEAEGAGKPGFPRSMLTHSAGFPTRDGAEWGRASDVCLAQHRVVALALTAHRVPGFAFWQIPDYNAPVVLSSDAHSVEDFCNRIHRTLMKSFKTCVPRQGPWPVAGPNRHGRPIVTGPARA